MFRILKTLIIAVWLIDILNIDFVINGIHVAQFLDVTVPLNGLFWFLLWVLIPTSEIISINN